MSECSIAGCVGIYQAKGLCRTHYARMKRTGTTDARPTIEERYWDYVLKADTDECWEWLGARSSEGYGRIGKKYAHRISCEWAYGPAPTPESVAMHACDNRPCVNPAHLSWGSQSRNVADCYRRQRR